MVRIGLVLVVLLASQRAWPCSGATCEQYYGVVPRPGSSIPANAPAIAIQQTLFSEASWDGGTGKQAFGAQAFGISLGDGGSIATRLATNGTEQWVVFDGGLSVGDTLQVAATLGTQCTSSGTLTVGPSAPLPTSVATISLAEKQTVEGTGSFCGGPLGLVQHAMLTITPSSELAPWAQLTRWELEVDGQNYATARYGAVGSVAQTGQPATSGAHPINTFHVQCAAGGDAGTQLDALLSPGMHSVRLLARIVGVDAPVASNTLSVNMDCVVPDAGVVASDAGSDAGAMVTDAGTPSVDAGTEAADAGVGNEPTPTGGCGCDAVPMLAGVVGLVALLRRRRR